MRIIKDTNIQFMSQYKLGAFLSGAVIILGIISLILAGGPLLSIDFKGGTLIAVHFEEPVDVNEELTFPVDVKEVKLPKDVTFG